MNHNVITSPQNHKLNALTQFLVSPFCGLVQELGFVTRSKFDMQMTIGSAALTGIHALYNRENPGRGAYHIGGTGTYLQEAQTKMLAESVERYAQMISPFFYREKMKFATYQQMHDKNMNVMNIRDLSFYKKQQLEMQGFPFVPMDQDRPISWIEMQNCFNQTILWIPAQCVLVGYNIRREHQEPWLISAVTTGTAAQHDYEKAYLNAIMELIQIDTIMGHWYGNWDCYRIIFDDRLKTLQRFIQKQLQYSLHAFHFYFIPNPNFQIFTVACTYQQELGRPKLVIGLGVDLNLENAMYKALLETIASIGLARMVLTKDHFDKKQPTNKIYDLDQNVALYANSNHPRIQDRFANMSTICARDLADDFNGTEQARLTFLLKTFEKYHLSLYHLDLTKGEIFDTTLKVVRVFSPDLLPLCLPSAPPKAHRRFEDYQGAQHDDPHPYP